MHDSHRDRLPSNEQSLAFRLRAGDVHALEEAFHAWYPGICRFVDARVGSAAIAEELVQDVFLRIWQTRDHLDVNGSLRSLLYRSAHNAALNYLKHRKIEKRFERSVTTSHTITSVIDDPASYSELSSAIDHALAVLPERCRLIFTMSRHDGLSYAQIADILGISIKTVETQMGRALKALRARLAPHL
jgi:RNA polymerase sigma-70 factor, ECF subfamily